MLIGILRKWRSLNYQSCCRFLLLKNSDETEAIDSVDKKVKELSALFLSDYSNDKEAASQQQQCVSDVQNELNKS